MIVSNTVNNVYGVTMLKTVLNWNAALLPRVTGTDYEFFKSIKGLLLALLSFLNKIRFWF